jgi:hypothetical protein
MPFLIHGGIVEDAMRSLRVAALLVSVITLGQGLSARAQATPTGQSICQMAGYRGTAIYNQYCGSASSGNANSNAAADAAAAEAARAAAEAAAAAERKRQAELAQARIDAENKLHVQEVEDQAKFLDDRDAVAGTLRGSTGTAPVAVGESGLRGSSVTPELRGSAPPPEQPVTDPMVVDARHVPTSLPKSVEAEIPSTPAGDRVRKGFEAIQDHDWNVARAWFQDALNHDPGNAGIARLVDLADYTLKREGRTHPPVTPQDDPATAAAGKQMDDQMNADLAQSLADFNRNYLPRHPELKQPWNAQAPAAEPTGTNSDWNTFFKTFFARPKRVLVPTAVSGVRG